MDHAEVLERIETAVAEPGGLARFGADPSPDAVAAREHIAGCGPCAAEWRAWSVVSLGLAAAAPDTLEPRAELRAQVLGAASARPRPAAATPQAAAPQAVAPRAALPQAAAAAESSSMTPTRSGISLGPRRARAAAAAAAAPAAAPASGPPFRWLLLGAAAVVVLFVAGMALGRSLVGTTPAPTQGTAVSSPAAPRGDPGRVLAEAAIILQTAGYRLAPLLTTPDGDAGGVVVVSRDGRLAVVSSVLPEPPEGIRYVCLLDRGGVQTQVGYMRWEPTANGSLAYWAGDAAPADMGLPGDVFIVQLDVPDAQPVLTGEFVG